MKIKKELGIVGIIVFLVIIIIFMHMLNYESTYSYSNILRNDSLNDPPNDSHKINDSCSVTRGMIGNRTNNTCGGKCLHPIMKPDFNMREVAKQCLLLEDHLNCKQKRCMDCIKKHFLMVDGLLDESVSLENDIKKRDIYRKLYTDWIKIEKKYSKDKSSNNIDDCSKIIRLFRKPLVERYFDLIGDYCVDE
jgi:hypothetical protein